MKKIFFCLLFSFPLLTICQENATDFTVSDCDGIEHHLFSELDQGTIIVLAWVMPCNPCATFTLPAYEAAHSFSESHPEKVLFYLIDDYANTSCTYISDWAQNYNMPDHISFSSNEISMSDYGENGMPKVTVVGGLDHRILFNERDVGITYEAVQLAIENQLNEMSIYVTEKQPEIAIFPNPTSGKIRIHHAFEGKTNYEISSILGRVMDVGFLDHSKGERYYESLLDFTDLGKGTYFIRFNSGKQKESFQISIQQ